MVSQPFLPPQQPSINEGVMNLVRVGMVLLYVSLLISSLVLNSKIITPDPEKYNAGCYPGDKYKPILEAKKVCKKCPVCSSAAAGSPPAAGSPAATGSAAAGSAAEGSAAEGKEPFGTQTETGSRCVYKPTTQEQLVVSYYNLIARPTTREFVDQDVCWLALSATIVWLILAVITFGRFISKNILQDKLQLVMILHTFLVAILPLLTWLIPWRLVPIPLDDDGEIDDLDFDDHIAYLPVLRQQRFWLFFITVLLIGGLMRAMSKFDQVKIGVTSGMRSIRSLGSRGYQQMRGSRPRMPRRAYVR